MSDMRDAVVSIYHERTNLASTLKVRHTCAVTLKAAAAGFPELIHICRLICLHHMTIGMKLDRDERVSSWLSYHEPGLHPSMLSLQDTKGAVGKLEMIFALLIHALACLAYLAIFSVSQRQPTRGIQAVHTAWVADMRSGSSARQCTLSVRILW